MSLPSTIRRLTEQASEYLPRATSATLDDLLAKAQRLGRVEMGGSWHPNGAEIRLDLGEDLTFVRSRKLPTIKENLAECIHRAEQYIRFHNSI